MKLNMNDRFSILAILPEKGNFATLKIVNDLQLSLSPSEEEFKEFEITFDGNTATWNQIKGRAEKKIQIGEKASDIIKESLLKLDKENKLDRNHVSVYQKFVGGQNA